MRVTRLKHKISETWPDLSTPRSPKPDSTTKASRPTVCSAPPRKRKAPEVINDNDEHQINAGSSPNNVVATSSVANAPGSTNLTLVVKKRQAPFDNHDDRSDEKATKKIDPKVSAASSIADKRHTRGKQLNYNLSALRGNGNADDGSETSEITDDSSDGDFDIRAAEAHSDTRDDLSMPSIKRAKKETSTLVLGPVTKSASTNRKNKAVAKIRPTARRRLPVKQATSAFKISAVQKRAPAKSILPPCDRPLPSIEASRPPSVASSESDSDSDSGSEKDIDIKELKPGTILSFGKDRTDSAQTNNHVDKTPRTLLPGSMANFSRNTWAIYGASDSDSDTSSNSSASSRIQYRPRKFFPDDNKSEIDKGDQKLNPATPPPSTSTSRNTTASGNGTWIVCDD